ncbi:hypothetical protein [Enterococcus avium]
MTEYGFEIKLKVVQDYLDGKGGYRVSFLNISTISKLVYFPFDD